MYFNKSILIEKLKKLYHVVSILFCYLPTDISSYATKHVVVEIKKWEFFRQVLCIAILTIALW